MKIQKYISALILALLFVGCTNDPLPVIQNLKLKVNNVSILDAFPYEIKDNDLFDFASSYRVISTLYLYDTKGNLVVSYDKNSTTYFLAEFGLPVDYGKYKAVIFTRFGKKSGIDINSLWDVYDKEKLSTLSIMGYRSDIRGVTGIIGLEVRDIELSPDTKESDLYIEMKPACALVISYIKNIHTFGDDGYYSLAANFSQYEIRYNNVDGIYYYVDFHAAPSDYLIEVGPSDHKRYDNVYSYFTLLPAGKTSFRYDYRTSDTNTPMSSIFTIDPKAGEEYLFTLNLKDSEHNDEVTTDITIVNGQSKSRDVSPADEDDSVQCVNVMELWEAINE